MSKYKIYTHNRLKNLEEEIEMEFPFDDDLLIGFKKDTPIGDAILELIYLSKELKLMLYRIKHEH